MSCEHTCSIARRAAALLLAGLVASTGSACNLDLNDPNFPTEEVVFANGENLMAIGVGIQAEMAGLMGPQIFSTSLAADEMGAGSATFANFMAADRGDELDPAQYLSEAPWAGAYRVVKLADDLLRSVPDASLRAGTKSGLLAMAGMFKAMAFAHLATLFDQAPIDVGIDKPAPTFVSRDAVLDEVLALLASARQELQTTPPSDEFRTSVQAPGFDLEVSIEALSARYALVAGDLNDALAAALRVPASARSDFRHSANDRNAVGDVMYRSGNAFQLRARQELRMGAESGDQRATYWVSAANITGANAPLDDLAQYRADDAAFPLFLPDEMKLIRAEVLARQNDLDGARDLINQVRTQCPSGPVTEPMACLPAKTAAELPDQAAVLAEILHQRRYELFLQGLRFDDLRRFDATRKYDFLPLPTSECDRNVNAPC